MFHATNVGNQDTSKSVNWFRGYFELQKNQKTLDQKKQTFFFLLGGERNRMFLRKASYTCKSFKCS